LHYGFFSVRIPLEEEFHWNKKFYWNSSYEITNISHMATKLKIYDLFKGISILYFKGMTQIEA